ncbi:AsmA family protein [Candidatus Magnetaquicoccus inordinatus]|uniref:AsmA family protein n=1 Tax=Candidatus Magnetaquicoccus inordinatus TaxID=2496818 RepID=UPI00102CEF49|nr:AsmA family protein [Candidatus Magnetaquicoccus inordinatus]
MAKLFKALLLLILLLCMAASALLWLLDPNSYKEQIIQLVGEKIGRRLSIHGQISWQLFPSLALRVGSASLANAEGFSAEPFAEWQELHLQLALQPLLKRQLQVEQIYIAGLRLHLQKKQDGSNNWQDLQRSTANGSHKQNHTSSAANTSGKANNTTATTTALTQSASPSAPTWTSRIAIASLRMEDAHLLWQDAEQANPRNLQIALLTMGPLAEQQPLPLQAQLRVHAAGQWYDQSELHLQGALLWNEQSAHINPLQLTFQQQNSRPGWAALHLQAQLSLLVDWQNNRLLLENGQLSGNGLQMQGDMEGRQLFTEPLFSGLLKIQPFSPRQVLPQWGVTLPNSRDPQTWQRLQAELPFTFDRESLTLNRLQLHLDESTLQGTGTLRNFAAPQLRFEGEVDRLDIDRYRPSGPSGTDSVPAPHPPQETTSASTATTPQPERLLPNSQGRLRIAQLRLASMHMQEAELHWQTNEGQIQLSPLQAKLYQGKMQLAASADLREKRPQWQLNTRLEGIHLAPLLLDLQGEAPLSGTLSAVSQLQTQGDTAAENKKQLQGKVQFTIKDGQIQGIDLEQTVREVQARLRGEIPVAEEGKRSTRFTALTGSATIKHGIVENRDLTMLSPLWRLRGEGKINLPEESLDYHLQLAFDQEAAAREGRTLRELAAWKIPVQASGALRHPTWKVDLHKLLEQEAAQQAREKLADKLQNKAAEALEKRGLQHLLPDDAGKRLLKILPIR